MQTGIQILTGFLLTVPFSDRFEDLDDLLKERLDLLRGGEIGPAHLHRANARKRKASA